MKYMLLIYMGENAMTDGERQQCYKDSTQLANDLHASGQFISANPLEPAASAKSVRVREGRRLITDGPFAETREVLGGFYLIEVDSQEQAVEIAARHPGARLGAVEVRPVLEIPNLPQVAGAE